jgi:putative flippase GtrA
MKKLITAAFKNRFIRFLCTGGLNTAVTYGIYLLLLQVTNYQISYTIAYVTGIIFTFLLNRLFVFKTHQGLKSLVLFPLVYVFQYFFGMLILWLGVQYLNLDVKFGPLVVVILSIPLTYLLSKFVFVGSDIKSSPVKITKKKSNRQKNIAKRKVIQSQ